MLTDWMMLVEVVIGPFVLKSIHVVRFVEYCTRYVLEGNAANEIIPLFPFILNERFGVVDAADPYS